MADPRFHTVSKPRTLGELAGLSGGSIAEGASADHVITDVAPLDEAGADQISFLDNIKYKDDFKSTKAGACVVAKEMAELAPEGCNVIISNSPYKSYALIAQAFYPDSLVGTAKGEVSSAAYIHSSAKIGKDCLIEEGAVIKEGAVVGDNCYIESNAVIGRNVEIGASSRIGACATVSHAVIGSYTRIYPGARIGQDGFGFAIDPAGHVKVPQLGKVIVGDHVEVGANSCIDRGAGPDTVIGDGTWIDNSVQIGHNAKIGKGCVIVAQAGVAGSTTLEDFVVVAAQVGIAGHLNIGMGSQIAAQSGVMQNLEPGSKVMGSPSLPIKQRLRQVAMLKKMLNK